MNMLRDLVDAHNKASKLEREIRQQRVDLIKGFKNRDSNDSDWHITKMKFVELFTELKRESNKIAVQFILQESDKTDLKDTESIDEYVDIVENLDGLSSFSEEIDINAFYNESIPINEEQSIQRSASRISVKVESEPKEPKMCESTTFVKVSEADIVPVSIPAISSKVILPNIDPKKEEIIEQKEYTPAPKLRNSVKCILNKINSGYKYGGKGFKVFTGFKNQCKPIYGSTTLLCRETANESEKLLKKYLIDNGKFNADSIENIVFKHSAYNGHYALIRVRASIKVIKNKMRQLNKNSNAQIITIFEPRRPFYSNVAVNNVLYVNNFDITDKQMHKRFTSLFCKYGELVKDIKMGIDRNSDPYAIVHFRHSDDAMQCVQDQNIRFGGKKLSINYSKKM